MKRKAGLAARCYNLLFGSDQPMRRSNATTFSGLYAYLAVSGLLNLSTSVLLLLPNFLKQADFSAQTVGWAIGLFFLVNLIFQIISGQFADRRGGIQTAMAGALTAIVGALFYLGAVWHVELVFPARILHGAGAAMVSAGALIQLIQTVPPHLKGRMIGYFGLPGFVMLGIGPLASEWFVYAWGFQGTFLLILVLFIVIFGVLTRLPRQLNRETGRRSFSEALKFTYPRLRPILMFSVFFGLCAASWNSFLAPAVRLVGAGAVSSFGLGYASGAVATRLGFSHRLDSGHKRLIAICILLPYGGALALVPHAEAPWHLLLIGLVCGIGHGMYYPSLSSIAAERFHPLYPGQGMSLYVSASNLGMFLGPPLWGILTDRSGYALVFAAAGSVLTLSTLLFIWTERQLFASRS
jgi:MFS family permease